MTETKKRVRSHGEEAGPASRGRHEGFNCNWKTVDDNRTRNICGMTERARGT